MQRHIGRAVIVASLLIGSASVRADVESAKKYLADAKKNIADGDAKEADTNLSLAEAEVEGDASAAAVTAEIKALREKMGATANAEAVAENTKKLDYQMKLLKDSIGQQSFSRVYEDLKEFLAEEDVKTTLGAETVAKSLKQAATFSKVSKKQEAAASLEWFTNRVNSIEEKWTEIQPDLKITDAPAARDNALDSISRQLDALTENVKQLSGVDDPAVKKQLDRYAKIEKDYKAEYLKGRAVEIYEQKKRFWESYATDWEGYDKETEGPSFETILKNQSQANSRLGAPKTAELISRADEWLRRLNEEEEFRLLAESDDKVKGLVAEVRKLRDDSAAKVAKFADAIVTEAEKTELDQDKRDRLDTLANDDLRLSLGESPLAAPLKARASKLVVAFDEKTLGAEAAKAKLLTSLTEQAKKDWPGIAERYKDAADSLDAVAAIADIDAFKGKTIKLSEANNRMGWDFRPGAGYDFAIHIDSVPVAGKYDPAIKKVWEDVATRTGKDFSDEPYDVIAVVEGTGPITVITRAEGQVKADDGSTATVKAQKDEKVEGIRLKIVAIHVGPIATAAAK